MTVTITLFKAQATVDAIPDLEVRAVQTMESLAAPGRASLDEPFREFEARNRAFFADEAKKLADALYATLPGGTLDALLVDLLDRKRSIYRVRHDEPDPLVRSLATEPSTDATPIEQALDRAKRIVVGSVVDVHRFESDGEPAGPVDFHGTVRTIDGEKVFVASNFGSCRTTLSHCALAEKRVVP